MDVKLLTLVAVLTAVIYAPTSQEWETTPAVRKVPGCTCGPGSKKSPDKPKPISLVERCYCRSTVNSLPRGYIRELRFIHTPNCPFQVIAKLKTNKEVCVNPEIRWLQQYLRNAISKMKKSRQGN